MSAGPKVCRKCRYSLESLPVDSFGLVQCPECAHVQIPRPRDRWRRWFGVPLGLGGLSNLVIWCIILSTNDGWAQMGLTIFFGPIAALAGAIIGTFIVFLGLARDVDDGRWGLFWKRIFIILLVSAVANVGVGFVGCWAAYTIHPGSGC